MYFDKASYLITIIIIIIIIPFLSNPLILFVTFIQAINCYCYNVFFKVYLWDIDVPLPLPSPSHHDVICSAFAVFLCVLTSFLEILQSSCKVEVHMYNGEQRYRGIRIKIFAPSFPLFISLNSARQFSKKSVSNITSPRLTRDSLYSLQFIFLFFFFSCSSSCP